MRHITHHIFGCATLKCSLYCCVVTLTICVVTQVSLIREGRGAEVVQETRLWDEFKLVTYSMRKKEGLADYRCAYMPVLAVFPVILVADWYLLPGLVWGLARTTCSFTALLLALACRCAACP